MLAVSRKVLNMYDFAIFIRPDAQIHTSFNSSWLTYFNSTKSLILLPDFDHWDGFSDKFAVMRARDVIPYGTRINNLAWYRKNVRYIVSEIYCKWVIQNNFELVRHVPFRFSIIRPS